MIVPVTIAKHMKIRKCTNNVFCQNLGKPQNFKKVSVFQTLNSIYVFCNSDSNKGVVVVYIDIFWGGVFFIKRVRIGESLFMTDQTFL